MTKRLKKRMFMTLSPLVDSIISARYLRKEEKTFEDICRRVVSAITSDKNEAERFLDAMISLKFLPNSPTLMNAGTDNSQLSACFTVPISDSIDGIFDAMKQGAIIHKTGGGTGYNFSQIRPEGSLVHSTGGIASGPVSFMRMFSAATNTMIQGGHRRGANMGILNVRHQDILKFISSKKNEGEISNFNISVMVDDEFMQNVLDKKFEKVWIENQQTGEQITIGKIWTAIINGIWENGEPGLLFYDEINRHNPTPHLGDIDTTNPCGEQPLLPFESCVLGSINLASCVHKKVFDENELKDIVRIAVRFLDAIIDKNVYPFPEIAEATKRTRKIGLGLMGVHDALLMIGLPYDSLDARTWCERIMKIVTDTAVDESHRLAEILGPFPAYKGSVWEKNPIRNAALTTIAPTGSISLLAGCSSGMEPVLSFAYYRNNTVGNRFVVVNKVFREALEEILSTMGIVGEEGTQRAMEVIRHVHECGTIQDLVWLPQEFRILFKTALDINWKDHIQMQTAFQKHVHASISKTINMPNKATTKDCEDALLMAWQLKLKGITIYRKGTRKEEVQFFIDPNRTSTNIIERPKELSGKTFVYQSGCGRLYITVNLLNKRPIEVFILTSGTGCEANVNALGRLISTSLQNNVPYDLLIKQLGKVTCKLALVNPESEGRSCADVIAKCIKFVAGEQETTRLCPECKNPVDFSEGCNTGVCYNCGWSGCG